MPPFPGLTPSLGWKREPARLYREIKPGRRAPLGLHTVSLRPRRPQTMFPEVPNALNGKLLVAASIQRASMALSSQSAERMRSAGGCQKVSIPDERAARHSPPTERPFVRAARPRAAEVRMRLTERPTEALHGNAELGKGPKRRGRFPGGRRAQAVWGSDTSSGHPSDDLTTAAKPSSFPIQPAPAPKEAPERARGPQGPSRAPAEQPREAGLAAAR